MDESKIKRPCNYRKCLFIVFLFMLYTFIFQKNLCLAQQQDFKERNFLIPDEIVKNFYLYKARDITISGIYAGIVRKENNGKYWWLLKGRKKSIYILSKLPFKLRTQTYTRDIIRTIVIGQVEIDSSPNIYILGRYVFYTMPHNSFPQISFPDDFSPFGAHPCGVHGDDRFFKEYAKMGISWIRNAGGDGGLVWDIIEPNLNGRYNWIFFDQRLKISLNKDFKVLVTTKAINTKDQRLCHRLARGNKYTQYKVLEYNPCNWHKYEQFLRESIRRYKNKIKYWQIENEPVTGGQYYADTPENYAKLLAFSYKIIKHECPKCKVVMAGRPGCTGLAYLIKVLETLKSFSFCKNSGCFDIFDIHVGSIIKPAERTEGTYFIYKQILNEFGYKQKPIYSTEFGPLDYSLTDKFKRDPNLEQKIRKVMPSVLIKMYASALAVGYKKLFWRVNEPPSSIIVMKGNSLEKCPSYYAYKILIHKLNRLKTAKKIAEGCYKFTLHNGRKLYILWCNSETYSLPEEVKKWKKIKVTYYDGREKIINTSNLKLSSMPIFVEKE